MAFGLRRTIPPTADPVHLDEAKLHVRQDFSDDDDFIERAIAQATRAVEEEIGRQLVAATWRLSYLDKPVGVVKLWRAAPLLSIDAVSYVAWDDGATETLAVTTGYRVDSDADPARLWPAWNALPSWPDVRPGPDAFKVTYTCGYLAPVTAVAATDVLTLTGRTLTSGEAVVLSNSGGALPAPLSPRTVYYARDISGQTFKLAATSGGSAIDLTDAGAGTHFVGEMPDPIRQAILLLVGDAYENRESGPVVAFSDTVKRLLAPFAVDRYAP